ncbi:MAG: hypothetical protein EON59_17960 [Alphaproteobacteria bacterium]|nr:MAG: hypothetical protein EON59_17960 [Alphaproteobacteria bacterium]
MAHQALRRAVTVAGSQLAFERITGVRQQNVSNWLRRGALLPAEHVIRTEQATGISRHDLRPDIYPVDQHPSSAHIATTLVRDGKGEAHFGRADEMKREGA